MSGWTRRRTLLVLVGAGLGAAIGALAAVLWLDHGPGGTGDSGTGVVDIGGPFTLVDQEGRTRQASDFAGRYMLVFFGYTHCPDVCPTTLQAVADTMDILEDTAGAEAARNIVPIFITVDPTRDTPDVMKEYAALFHPRLVGLTGSEEQVAAAAKAYRVYYARRGEDSDYLMDHSAFIYLMGPDGRYITHFRPGMAPEEMAAKIREAM